MEWFSYFSPSVLSFILSQSMPQCWCIFAPTEYGLQVDSLSKVKFSLNEKNLCKNQYYSWLQPLVGSVLSILAVLNKKNYTNNVHFWKKPFFPFQISYPLPESLVSYCRSGECPCICNNNGGLLSCFIYLFFFFFPVPFVCLFVFNLAIHQDVSSQWERKSETDALAMWVQMGRFFQWKIKYLGKSIFDYVNSRCFGSVPF